MNIEIKIEAHERELTQAQSQTIRRVATVLRTHNLTVDIIYTDPHRGIRSQIALQPTL
jgi:adenylate cyclase class IV